MKKENDLLEETLSIAENSYAEAYRFLQEEYKKNPENYGPQTLYFLACLAGGAGMPEKALEWLRRAIFDNGWWYRPEVLEDEDLISLKNNTEFNSLKSVSDNRYAEAVSKTKEVFTWKRKTADKLFLAVHGNTQNGQIASDDWKPLLKENTQWQLETIQSAEPDGYGTYRWSYDMVSYVPVAKAIEKIQNEGYKEIVCGGFSAGCDMLLRAIIFTPVRCDILILQSPWIPILKDCSEALVNAVKRKNIELKIFCGSDDEDCLPLAKQLYEITKEESIHAEFTIQKGNRHQFPKEVFDLKDLL
ncbi:MAG: TPR end-of-group domain-containing protein [Anaerovoracaceae bacterium]